MPQCTRLLAWHWWSQAIQSAAGILPNVDSRTEVVGIDESNFIGPDLVNVARHLADSGKQVLNRRVGYRLHGAPFAPMPELLNLAESIAKALAICMRCGKPAKHSERLVESTDDKRS